MPHDAPSCAPPGTGFSAEALLCPLSGPLNDSTYILSSTSFSFRRNRRTLRPFRHGVGRADPEKESMMSTLQTSRAPVRILARTSLLVAFLTTVGIASAQPGAAPERASPVEPAKNATTSQAVKQHDPFSPFVWDVLGATPSIRLPWQRETSAAKPAAPERVTAAKEAEAAPGAERTTTAARR